MNQRADATFGLAGRRVHFIGIGGAGMRAIAIVARQLGAAVSGSDQVATGDTKKLEKAGISVAIGQRPANIPAACDLVVVSAAVPAENVEYAAARERGLPVLKYAEMLGRMMAMRRGIAVAGTHGKSSTTSMVAFVLRECGLDPSFVVGAEVPQLGGPSGAGRGEWFVAEACEYDRNFLAMSPEIAIINNVDADHLDTYGDLAGVIGGFAAFARKVQARGRIIVNGDDANAMQAVAAAVEAARGEKVSDTFSPEREKVSDTIVVETFGKGREADWRAELHEPEHGCGRFTIHHGRRRVADVALAIAGEHQALNAAAAIAACAAAGVDPQRAADVLARFTGAERRMTVRWRDRDCVVVDDYGHHPTEIAATLKAARDYFSPRRLVCVFQPHQASRTRLLLDGFAGCFSGADRLIVCEIYSVRDREADRAAVSAGMLAGRVRAAGGPADACAATLAGAAEIVKKDLRKGDAVIVIGAGDVYKVADELVRWLGEDRQA